MIITYNKEKILSIFYKNGKKEIIKVKSREEAEEIVKKLDSNDIDYVTLEN